MWFTYKYKFLFNAKYLYEGMPCYSIIYIFLFTWIYTLFVSLTPYYFYYLWIQCMTQWIWYGFLLKLPSKEYIFFFIIYICLNSMNESIDYMNYTLWFSVNSRFILNTWTCILDILTRRFSFLSFFFSFLRT